MPQALQSHGAPVVIPRWEWRTFAPALDCLQVLGAAGTRLMAEDGCETSLLCLGSSHDVAIRGGRMALKWRKQVGMDGLELWDTVLEFGFPCSRETVQRLFEIWGLPVPDLGRTTYSLEAFLADVIQVQPGLRKVEVEKHADAFLVEGTRCEWTRLAANGIAFETLCIEHEDPDLTLQVVRRLGLESRPHVSYPTGLKAALELSNPH